MNRTRLFQRCIIGALLAASLALLGGCGALRLAYNRADDAVYWWLDGYIDFDAAQTPRVRAALDDYHRWHRRHELPGYADMLARIRAAVPEATDADAVCRWTGEIEAYRASLMRQAVPALADLAATITPAQIEHLERRYAKGNDEYRKDFMQSDAAERQRAAAKRFVSRAETLYGRLTDTQRARLVAAVAASPFDAQRQFDERVARQADIVRTLREMRAARARVEAAVAALVERVDHSPRVEFRAYQAQLARHNCRLIAELHNDTGAAQRRKAIEHLAGWEEDLRELAKPR